MTTARKLLLSAVAVAGASFVARKVRDAVSDYDFADRVAVIAGGSRGLGLVLARELARCKAHVAILARDADELDRASSELQSAGADVFAATCDIRDPKQVQQTVERILARFGQIDILINNAGIIQVGPLDHMTDDDFRDALDVHFWGPYYMTQAILPAMRARREGRIINISSIGGKIAAPHLAPYSASKFALSGFSQALRSELVRDGIYVTSVYPGLMRTGSHFNALFKGQNSKEFTWFALCDSLPFFSTTARRAARETLAACRRGDAQLVITLPAKLAVLANNLFPNTFARFLEWTNALLPGPSAEHGVELYSGWESRSRLAPSLLTRLADRATAQNNELRGHAPPA